MSFQMKLVYSIQKIYSKLCPLYIGMLCLLPFGLSAQNNYDMPASGIDSIFCCDAYVYDVGGEEGAYLPDNNATLVVFPTFESSYVALSGACSIESGYDFVYVYDGVDTSGVLLATLTGDVSSLSVHSLTGPITIVFVSDHYNQDSGFAFHITCREWPTCVKPHQITITAVTDSSAHIEWSGDAADYNVEYGIAGFIRGTGISLSVPDTFVNLSGLSSGHSYNVYIQGICYAGDSSFTASAAFTTACAPIATMPFIERFDEWEGDPYDYTAHIPACWYALNTGTDNNRYPLISSSPGDAYSGANMLKFSTYIYSGFGDQYAVLPPMDTSVISISDLELTFLLRYSYTEGQVEVGVMTDFANPLSFVPVDTIVAQAAYTLCSVSFASYSGTGNYIALRVSQSLCTFTNTALVDNIMLDVVPTCSRVTGLHVTTSSQPDNISLAWDNMAGAAPYEVIHGPKDFNPLVSGIIQSGIMTASTTIEGLSSDTLYDFYVRRSCNAANSPWCVLPATAAPATFFMQPTGTDTFYTCKATIYDDGGPFQHNSSSCNTTLIVYPSTDSVISFYGSITHEVYSEYLTVYDGVGTSGIVLYRSSDTMTYESFGPLVSLSGPITIVFTSGFFNNYDGFDIHVSCIDAQDCPYVQDFTLTNVRQEELDFSWSPAEGASSYLILYGLHGFDPNVEGMMATFYDTTATIGNLSDSTYDFYIMADCGLTNGQISLHPIVAGPHQYLMQPNGNGRVSMCEGILYDDGGVDEVYAADCASVLTIYPASEDSVISLSGMVEVEAHHDILSIYDGAGLDGYRLFTSSQTDTVLNLVSAIGPVTIAFSSNGNIAYQGFALNVACVAAPECRQPTNITVVRTDTTSVSLTWDSFSGSQWQVVCSTAEGVPDTSAMAAAVSTDSNAVTIDNLVPGTHYYVYVRAYCETGYGSWSYPVDFKTYCTASQLPVNYDFETYEVGFSADFSICWNRINRSPEYAYYPYIDTYEPHSGGKSLYFYAANTNLYAEQSYAVLPFFDPVAYPVNSLQLSFYGKKEYEDVSAISQVVIGILSTPDDVSDFVPVDTVNITSEIYQQYVVMLDQYSGNGSFIALQCPRPIHATTYANAFYLDDIKIEVIPHCQPPINVVTMPAGRDVSIGWENVLPAEEWQILYGPTGFDPETEGHLISGVMTNPYTIYDLNADTLYDFYVRNVCAALDMSAWSRPVSGLPASYYLPVMGVDTLYTCEGHLYDDGGYSDTYAANAYGIVVLYPTDEDALVRLTGAYSTEEDLLSLGNYYDAISIYDGSNTNGTLLAYVGGQGTLDIMSLSGPLTVLFSSNESTNLPGFDFVVSCESLQGCPTPTLLTANAVTTTTATLSWEQASSTDCAWELQYKQVDDPEYVTLNITENPYTLYDLSPDTYYEVRVRARCNNNMVSNYSETILFTTASVGVSHYAGLQQIRLYPNPAASSVFVETTPITNISELKVYDVYGKLLQTFTVNDNTTRINVSSLADGVYIVRAITEVGIINKSFIKR